MERHLLHGIPVLGIEWKFKLTLVLVIYLDGSPVHRQSPIQVVTAS